MQLSGYVRVVTVWCHAEGWFGGPICRKRLMYTRWDGSARLGDWDMPASISRGEGKVNYRHRPEPRFGSADALSSRLYRRQM